MSLTQLIRDYVGRRDPRGISELAMRARGFGESLKDALAKADEVHRDMERAAADAQRFDVSEGRWRGATEKLRGQARRSSSIGRRRARRRMPRATSSPRATRTANEHKRIQSDSSKCEASEITIPGERMRLDCVRVSSGTCYIVEIKPNNSAAEAKGRARLQDYVRAVRNWVDSNKDRIDSVFTDKLSIFKRCINNGRLLVETELRVYDFCPADGKLFNDFVVP